MSNITHNTAGVGASPPDPLLPTVSDFLQAFGQQPVEIVDGVFIPMHPPGRLHGIYTHLVLFDLNTFVSSRHLGLVFTEVPFVLDGSERSDWVRYSRIPDISFIALGRIEAHNREHPDPTGPWWLAPDIAGEVVSPTDSYLEIDDKVAEYLRYGVRLIWVINPRLRTVKVVTPDNPAGYILTDQDTLTASPVLEGWSMPVAHIFDVMPSA
jgi:Uma2 family endonuclease